MSYQRHNRIQAVTVIFWIGAILILGCVGVLFVRAWDYYALPRIDRPLSSDHETLRSSGRVGLVYAVTGLSLILFNLGYLVRRHWLHWHWLGPMKVWLGLHMLTGLAAVSIVTLHTALSFSSVIATVAFCALVVTVLSGVFGFALYTRVSYVVMADNEPDHSPGAVKRWIAQWRFFHRWLAITLVMMVIGHVIVAVRFGGLWLLGGHH